jgi:adenylate kinase family enzyme
VVGTTGSGKTTLARRLASALDLPHVELDALHWGADWTPAPLELFRQRVARALSGERWVVDGNYGKVRDIVWARADSVVWLDYPLPVILGRLLQRTLGRVISKRELWSGNRETVKSTFSRDSILLWALKTYARRRREYPTLLASPEDQHRFAVRLRSPRRADAWLKGLSARAKRDKERD